MRKKCFNSNLTFADSLFSNVNSSFFSFYNKKYSWYRHKHRSFFSHFKSHNSTNSTNLYNNYLKNIFSRHVKKIYSDNDVNFLLLLKQQKARLSSSNYITFKNKNTNFFSLYQNKLKYSKYLLSNYGSFRRKISLLDFYSCFFLSSK